MRPRSHNRLSNSAAAEVINYFSMKYSVVGMDVEEQEVVSGGSGNGERVEGPVLPRELLFVIISMGLHADVRDVQRLSLVSRLFKAGCDSHCRSCRSCNNLCLLMSNLQPLHVRPQLADELGLGVHSTLSVRRLMKAAGRGSGLGIALKSMLLCHPKWWSAWVTIVPTNSEFPDWYRIVSVSWRKKKLILQAPCIA